LQFGFFLSLGFLEDPDDVEHDPAGRERLHMLDAKLLQVVLGDIFTHRGLVIVAVLDPDMAQPVDMRADVALGEVGILHAGELVLAVLSPWRQGRGVQDGFLEACAVQWHAIHQNIPQRNDFAGLDFRRGRLGYLGRNAVGCADIIFRTERRWLDQSLTVALRKRDAGGAKCHDGSERSRCGEFLERHGGPLG